MTAPLYPKDVLDVPDSWARLMGEFWLERFQQPEALMGILRWLEAARAQLDTDLDEAEKSVAINTMPTVHREWWVPVTLVDVQSGKLLTYGGGATYGGSSTNSQGVGQVFAYGVRSSPYGSHRMFALPPGVVGVTAIMDAPAVPAVCWTAGTDIFVDAKLGAVVLPVDPFADSRFADMVVTTPDGRRELTLWAFGCDVDWRLGYSRIGYALDADLPSSTAASKVLRALWKSAIRGGATLDDVYQTLLAVAGIEGPTQQETVLTLTEDEGRPVVCTDRSTYRLPVGALVRVAPGDVIDVGSPLTYDVSAHIAPRAWYPWGAIARRVPVLAQSDPYVAVTHTPDPIPVPAIPEIRLAAPGTMRYDALLAGAAEEVEQAANTVLSQLVTARPETPTAPVTPETAAPFRNGLSLAIRNPPIMVEVYTGGTHPAPTTYFSGTPGQRGVSLTARSVFYAWVHPQTNEMLPFYSVTKEEAERRGFERRDISSMSDAYPVQFPDVLMAYPKGPTEMTEGQTGLTNALDIRADAIRAGKFKYTGDPATSPVDVYVERFDMMSRDFEAQGINGSWGYASAASLAGSAIADADVYVYGFMLHVRAASTFRYPYTFTVRVTGGATIRGANSSSGIEHDIAWDRPPRTAGAVRKSATEWEITAYGDDTIGVWLDVSNYGAEVDICSAPSVTQVTNVAYQNEYTGGAPGSQVVGRQAADLVLPGGVETAGDEARRLYEQQAGGLLPAPVVVRAGQPRVMLIASHPNESTALLSEAIKAATGYDVDLFYAWELRRGIATNTLRVTGGGAVHSFKDAVDAVTSGVRVTKFVPAPGGASRAVHEDCTYALVVWDSAGGIADLKTVEQEMYGGGLMPGDVISRMAQASSAYAWRVADPAIARYTKLLESARLEYSAATQAAADAVEAAEDRPPSDPLVMAAATARLTAQRKLEVVKKLEREMAVDARLWGLHGGVILVLKAAQLVNRGIMVTGGTLARDMSVLTADEQAVLTQILGVRIADATTIGGAQAAQVPGTTGLTLPGSLVNMVLPVERGIQATTAAPVLQVAGAGHVITANDAAWRAVLCNYRLLNKPADYLPQPDPSAVVEPETLRVAGVKIVSAYDRDPEYQQATTVELIGTTDFYTPMWHKDLEAYAEYVKYANAARAVAEYVVVGVAATTEIRLCAQAVAALESAGYSGDTMTVARAAELSKELLMRAQLAGYRVHSDKAASKTVEITLTDEVPYDMLLRYTIRQYTDEYSVVPSMVAVYDMPAPGKLYMSPLGVCLDTGEAGPWATNNLSVFAYDVGKLYRDGVAGGYRPVDAFWSVLCRAEIELSLVSRGTLAAVIRDNTLTVENDWRANVDEVKVATIRIGDGGGVGIFDDGYAPIIKHQVGKWDTLDSRIRNAALPGRVLVTAGTESGLGSSDVVYFTADGYEFSVAPPAPTGVVDRAPVYLVEQPTQSRVMGTTHGRTLHMICAQLTLNGQTRQFNTVVVSRETVLAPIGGAGGHPQGIVVSPSPLKSVTWRTIDIGGDPVGGWNSGNEIGWAWSRVIQEGVAEVQGQAWTTAQRVDGSSSSEVSSSSGGEDDRPFLYDFEKTRAAVLEAPGRIMFEALCTLDDGAVIRSYVSWPGPAGLDVAPFGDPATITVGAEPVCKVQPAGTLVGTVVQIPEVADWRNAGGCVEDDWGVRPTTLLRDVEKAAQVTDPAIRDAYPHLRALVLEEEARAVPVEGNRTPATLQAAAAVVESRYAHLAEVVASEFNVTHRVWKEGSFEQTPRYHYFAIVYEGQSYFRAGTYTFHIRSESGARLFIGEKDAPTVAAGDADLLINDAIEHAEHEVSRKVTIAYDGMYPVRLEYFQGVCWYVTFVVEVTPPGGARRIWKVEVPPPYFTVGSLRLPDTQRTTAAMPDALGARATIVGITKSDALVVLSGEVRASAAGYKLLGYHAAGAMTEGEQSGGATLGTGSSADFSGYAAAMVKLPPRRWIDAIPVSMSKVQLMVADVSGAVALGDAYHVSDIAGGDPEQFPDVAGCILPAGTGGRYAVIAAPTTPGVWGALSNDESAFVTVMTGQWVAIQYTLESGAVTLVLTYGGRYRARVVLAADKANRVTVYQRQQQRNTPTIHYVRAFGSGRLALTAAKENPGNVLTEAAGYLANATDELAIRAPGATAPLASAERIGVIMVEEELASCAVRDMVLYQ